MARCCNARQPRYADIAFPLNPYDIPLHESSDTETSISENSTDIDSEMSEYDRYVLTNRYSRPQKVERWDLFSLKSVSDNRWWARALRMPAKDPLSEADTLRALSEILRRSAETCSSWRMVRRTNRVERGMDDMGYELLKDARVLVFNISLSDNVLHVNKELSGETVWSKALDQLEAMPYTSTRLLDDFMKDFNLSRGAFCKTTGVLARFQVVCPKTHRLCRDIRRRHERQPTESTVCEERQSTEISEGSMSS